MMANTHIQFNFFHIAETFVLFDTIWGSRFYQGPKTFRKKRAKDMTNFHQQILEGFLLVFLENWRK